MNGFASISASPGDVAWAMQLFWGIGFFGLFLIILQALFGLFVGHDGDTNVDSSIDTHGGHGGYATFLSLKSISAILLGLGFGGAYLDRIGLSIGLAALGGLVIGMLIGASYITLMNSLNKLRSDGTAKLTDAVNRTGTVYLPITAEGPGEIQVSFGGCLRNVQAFTSGPTLPVGTQVRVLALHGEKAVLVEKSE